MGFEFVGADGIQPKSMTSETKLRGKWGDNLLLRPLIVSGMLYNPKPIPNPNPNPNTNPETNQVGHMLSCPSCDPSIALGLTHVSMGTFVVPDNGVDCLNGCQVGVRLSVRARAGFSVRATVRVKTRARASVGARARTTARVGFDCPAKPNPHLHGCQTFDLGYEERSDDYLFGGHIINAPRNDGNQDGKRLGLETPAWYRLTCGWGSG